MFLSVVIPVYQAEAVLEELASRLSKVLEGVGRTYEILLVDDGSTDGSWRVLESLTQTTPHLTAVKLSRNFGQHHAITAGLDLAQGEYTVVMDCDLQDPPEAIPDLLAKAEEGHPLVLAARSNRKDPLASRLAGALYYRVFGWLTGRRLDPSVGTFRVMRRPVVNAFKQMRESTRYFGAMIDWLGFEPVTVEVEHGARPRGKSTYSLTRRIGLSLDGFVAFSNRPLYLSVALGSILTAGAAVYGVYVLVRLVVGAGVNLAWPLWLLAFLGGLILLNLGIIGLYLGRLFDQAKGRPLYVVDRIVGERPEAGDE